MFAKALCIVMLAYLMVRCAIPPPLAKTTKDDKIKDEGRLVKASIAAARFFTPLVIITISALHVKGMVDGFLPQDLKAWHVAATVSAILGWQLRCWSFRALDRFFTYELAIRPGHRLIGTGPYTYLRHPSYTAILLTGVPWVIVTFYQGIGDLVFPYTNIRCTAAGTTIGAFAFFGAMLFTRVVKEEAMLRDHFGREFDEYCRKRKRLIPFVF